MLKKIILASLFSLSLLCVFMQNSIFAAGVRIDQAKIRLNVPAGGVKTGTIKVENTSDLATAIRVYLEDWYYLPPFDGVKEFKPAGTLPLSGANWISFTPAEFTLPAYGAQVVNFTVNMPKDASGGHYAVMFFEMSMGQAPKEEGVFVDMVGRIATLFYFESEGTVNKRVNMENFSLTRTSKAMPLEITTDFHNIGNVDITAKGTYYIIDKEGIVYARGEFNDVYTLPDDAARISAAWRETIPQGKYDLVMTLDLGGGMPKVQEVEFQVGSNGGIIRVGDLK